MLNPNTINLETVIKTKRTIGQKQNDIVETKYKNQRANILDPDEMANREPIHVDLLCLQTPFFQYMYVKGRHCSLVV